MNDKIMKNSMEEERLKEYFKVSVEKYCPDKHFSVVRPASLNKPKNWAVMFIMEKYMDKATVFEDVENCLIFWPESVDVPGDIEGRHAVCKVADPHKEFARFFFENRITYLPEFGEYEAVNGACIAKGAEIGRNCKIFPGAYIGPEVTMGDNVYIGFGAKLSGEIHIGNNVVIRENSVIGADGLTTDRDEDGKALTIPQFGGVVLEDDVQIGALTVIGRGAIDNTVIKRGSKIDNSCFISHNVQIGEDAFVVGETIMFGSSSLGDQGYISGNATIRDGRHVGNRAKVGMGAVVTKNVDDGAVVKGNPAK